MKIGYFGWRCEGSEILGLLCQRWAGECRGGYGQNRRYYIVEPSDAAELYAYVGRIQKWENGFGWIEAKGGRAEARLRLQAAENNRRWPAEEIIFDFRNNKTI
jgi:hypothetical protein